MTLKNIDICDIIILNKQTADGASDTIEEKAEGSFRQKNGKSYIMYESVEEGLKTSSTIIASDSEVKIKRKGLINSEMLCRRNEKTKFTYNLPYGSMEIEVEAHTIENGFDDDGGRLHMAYTLCIQGEMYYNDMTIIINKR